MKILHISGQTSQPSDRQRITNCQKTAHIQNEENIHSEQRSYAKVFVKLIDRNGVVLFLLISDRKTSYIL